MFDIREIIAIDCIAHLRSFKLAAEKLNTTQPTLSRLIAKAESELGVILFRRGWSGTETTVQGDIVGQYCSLAVTSIVQTEQKLFADRARYPSLGSNISLHKLEAIDAICRTGSASLAATKLGRSQPAISRALSIFQSYFGLTLFKRTRRGLIPLPAAQELVALYGTLSRHIINLQEHLNKNSDDITGRVAIGMLPFSGQDLISKVFAELSNLHPKIRLVCVPGSYNGLVEALRRREIELMIGILRGPELYEGLAESPLYDETFTVVARHDHPLHDTVQSANDLEKTNWIVAPHGTPVRTYFEQLFSTFGAVPPIQTCEMLSFSAAEELLTQSNSIAMLSYGQSKLATIRKDLKRIDIELPNAVISIGITKLANCPREPAIEKFEQLLMGIIKVQNY
ncbi:MAG: hypothetical protein COB84_06740 [Rhodobacteraceae bacterium]|nr:MAG: hypothetical protein COB84_06740 [Paracoccaceae bacterium]